MHVVPVTKLMRQDSFDFFWFALLDEGVEDDNMFGLILTKVSTLQSLRVEGEELTHGNPKK